MRLAFASFCACALFCADDQRLGDRGAAFLFGERGSGATAEMLRTGAGYKSVRREQSIARLSGIAYDARLPIWDLAARHGGGGALEGLAHAVFHCACCVVVVVVLVLMVSLDLEREKLEWYPTRRCAVVSV